MLESQTITDAHIRNHGKRAVTADTAIRFSKFFGTTAEMYAYA